MSPLRTMAAAGLLVVVQPLLAPPVQSPDGLTAALDWLRTQQRSDGGFSNGFTPESDLAATADAVVAIASAGEAPGSWRRHGASPLDFIAAGSGAETSPGVGAKVVIALVAAGEEPRGFGDLDWVSLAVFAVDGTSAGPSLFDQALAVLALVAAGEAIPPQAIPALVAARLPDGSYAFDGSMTQGDSNTTALVVQALLAAGAEAESRASYDYFRATQNPDGGWTYQKPSPFGEATDANSTGLVVQALLAGGEDLSDWNDPLSALIGLQQPSGALAFNADTPGDNFLATVQAIPALAGVDLTDLPRAPGPMDRGPLPGVILGAAAVTLSIALLVFWLMGRAERRA